MASEDSMTSRIYGEIGSDPIYESMTETTQEIRLHEAGQRILRASIEVAELLKKYGVVPPLEGFPSPNPFDEELRGCNLYRHIGPKGKNFWILDLHFAWGDSKTWGTGLQEHGKLITLPEGSGVGTDAKKLFTEKYIADEDRSIIVPELRAQRWCDRLVTFGATVLKGEFYKPKLTGHNLELPAPPPRLLPPEQPRYYPPSVETSSPTRFIPAGTGYDDTRNY